MKETASALRSSDEKEKTKMRERQRRSITTKIFQGLRKHGGYHLSARADINEVLRHLAAEAGWIVDSDGTTYRASTSTKNSNSCPLCGGARKSPESITTDSRAVGESFLGIGRPTTAYFSRFSAAASSLTSEGEVPHHNLQVSMCGTIHPRASGGTSVVGMGYHQQQLYLQEARALSQNAPVGYPRRRA